MRLFWFTLLVAIPASVFAQDVPLPRPRPEAPAPAEIRPPESPPLVADHEAVPKQSTPRIFQTACPAVIDGLVVAKPLPPLSEGTCGERSPLELDGVVLRGRIVPVNGKVVTNCQMATAMPQWLNDVDGYISAHDNTHIAAINVGTSYMCRDRVTGTPNDTPSEHGFADAMDVTGFTLDDGRTITVDTAWPGTEEQGSRIVRFAHDAACSIFTTVLGPEANALHHDHLHVDLGCHGKTCTARLCE